MFGEGLRVVEKGHFVQRQVECGLGYWVLLLVFREKGEHLPVRHEQRVEGLASGPTVRLRM